MSCCTSCGDTTDACRCNPCSQVLTNESLASALSNLITNLFGAFTKTTVNGRSVWSQVCNAESTGLSCNPRTTDEGFICYLLRLMDNLGLFFGGTWNNVSTYCKNTFVTYGTASYVALVDVGAGVIPGSDGTKWQLILQGSAGPQGPAGPAGSGSPSTFAFRSTTVNLTLNNTDDVIFCSPAADMTITIPLMSGLDSGKGYQIINVTGLHNVTIQSAATDTFTSPSGSAQASYVISSAMETANWRSKNSGVWYLN